MMRNSNPKIRTLNKYQFETLKEMGFCKHYDGMNRLIDDINTEAFYKPYNCCGGVFKLKIQLGRYTFCGNEIYPFVKIESPYDRFWSKNWGISEFTKSMEEFQNALRNDLKRLRKIGVIT